MHTLTAYRFLHTNKAKIPDPSEKDETNADQVAEEVEEADEVEQDAEDEEI